MTTSKLTLGPAVYSPSMEGSVPSTITTPEGLVFTWDEDQGYFASATGAAIYIEPNDADGTITEDTYYEVL